MPVKSFKRKFSRKMLPLCVAVSLVLSVVPPLSYGIISKKKQAQQAKIYARLLAHDLSRAAGESYLWQYRTNKILLYTEKHRFQQDIAYITVSNCKGEPILNSLELGIGTGHREGGQATTWITSGNRNVGSVQVVLDPRSDNVIIQLMAVASVVFGFALGSLLYVFPVSVVGKQANELARAQGRLKMLDVLEDERRRIARDLHDGVGQAMTALQIELKLAAREAAFNSHVTEAGVLAEEALDEIRAAISALKPPPLGEQGFGDALRNMLEGFELRSAIHSSIRITGPLAILNDSTAQMLYRVIQEALTNVLRHSNATEVGVVLDINSARVVLSICDNGEGFHVETAKLGGIDGIRERIEFYKGEMMVRSKIHEGTELHMTIPLSEA